PLQRAASPTLTDNACKSCMRAPEVGLPLLGGPRRPQRNRAQTHRLAGPRGSEAARPKINHFEFGVPRPRRVPRCWDSTLAAWYPSLYAPRTGGAYDSHHRTAVIAGRTRRRRGVAARGAGAAAGGAGDRLSPHDSGGPPSASGVLSSDAAPSKGWQRP